MRRQGGKTLRQVIQRRAIKQDLHALIDSALSQSAKDAIALAVQYSSGSVDSQAEDHPYSKAHPNAAFDPALINIGVHGKHPGKKFSQSWETLPPSKGFGIRNTSWVGPFLEQKNGGGPKGRMLARPIDKLIVQALDPVVRRNLDKAFRDGTFQVSATILRPAAM